MNLSSLPCLLLLFCFATLIPGVSAVWWSLLPNLNNYWSRLWNFNLLKSRPFDSSTPAPAVWSLANPGQDGGAPFTPMPNNQIPQFVPSNIHDVKVSHGGPPVHEHPYPPPQFGPIPSRPNHPPQPPKFQGQIQFPFQIPQEQTRGPSRPHAESQGVTIPPSFQWTPIMQVKQPTTQTFVTLPPEFAPPELIPIYPDVLPGSNGNKPDSDNPLPMFLVNPSVFEGLVFPASGLPIDINLMNSLPHNFIPGTKPGSTVWHTFDTKNKVPGLPGTFHASLSLHYEPEASNDAKDPRPTKPVIPPPTRRPSIQSLFKPTRPSLKKRTDTTTMVVTTTRTPLQQAEATDLHTEILDTPSFTSSTSQDLDRWVDEAATMTNLETSGDADWTYPDGNQTSSDESNQSIVNSGIDPRSKGNTPKKRSLTSGPVNQDGVITRTGNGWSLRQLFHKRHDSVRHDSSQHVTEHSDSKPTNVANGGTHIMAKVQTRGSSADTTFISLSTATMKHKEFLPRKLKHFRKLIRANPSMFRKEGLF